MSLQEGIEWLENYKPEMVDVVQERLGKCQHVSIHAHKYSDGSSVTCVFGQLENDEGYLVWALTEKDKE
ncbi:hypothetical protein [Levilactobacillus brevis]|uniref:hypothetical protein n=1 Tax=Levilactobacillus brevis TaxID=1580 RepID=UPI00111999D9|nr:hypothetical protein [Levilactobacillus brevis]QCZ46807.1 Hypothetical protein UCCLB556_1930 [Levilactobacillus brevis]